MRTPMNRRTFLRGAGVAIALPMLEAMTGNAGERRQPIKRFVCLSNNYGVYQESFFPDPRQVGASYDLPETLAPLERHRRDFTIFSNLDHGNTGGHQGVPVLLSGVRPHMAFGFPEGNISVDQKIAEFEGSRTRFSSMTLQVNEANLISFTRTGVQVPSINLQQMYRALFIEDGQAARASARERMARHHSILDVVRDEANAMNRNLGAHDQRKMQEYFESVRSLERRIEQQQPWLDRPRPRTNHPEPRQGRGTAADLRAMMELIALAIQTDSTRAITLASGFQNNDFGLSGGYHGFSHHGQREREVAALRLIERNQIAQMAFLMELLKAQQDPISGGTLFDHTSILFGCGMATGEHSTRKLPLILAGGGFRHGEHKVYPEENSRRVPAANLLLSILRNHGVQANRFGTSSGTLTGLEGGRS